MICWHPVEWPMRAMMVLPVEEEEEGVSGTSTLEDEREGEARTPCLEEVDAGLNLVRISL